jgi:hypothetical protein
MEFLITQQKVQIIPNPESMLASIAELRGATRVMECKKQGKSTPECATQFAMRNGKKNQDARWLSENAPRLRMANAPCDRETGLCDFDAVVAGKILNTSPPCRA